MMANCPHTSFRKGKRILVILNNGDKFVDKFVENKSKSIVLENHGNVAVSDIRSTSIYRWR